VSNSVVEALTLGGRALKRLKQSGARVRALVERVPKTAPQNRHFLLPFRRDRERLRISPLPSGDLRDYR
jgi:hypothetical protein